MVTDNKSISWEEHSQQVIADQRDANNQERRLNVIKRIKIIARGMFEAKQGKWSGDNYHVWVRIRPESEMMNTKADDLAIPDFAQVMFSMIGRDWRIIGFPNMQHEHIDLDYMESFDKIDNT